MVLKLGVEIPSTPADGKINTIWVPAIADIHAPTVTEINAGTDLSNYVTLGGWSLEESQDKIDDKRENSQLDYEIPGRKKISGPTVEVIDNTNTDHEEENEAITTLVEGAEGYFVRRRGMPTETAFAADQEVAVYSVRIGMTAPVKIDENSVQRSVVSFATQAPGWDSHAKVKVGA